jgi:hypothetical protein
MRLARILLSAALVCGAGSMAWADMCAHCKDKMFTADIGKCNECGAATRSGGIHLCAACSKKLDKCEACQMPLKATTQPATKPAHDHD